MYNLSKYSAVYICDIFTEMNMNYRTLIRIKEVLMLEIQITHPHIYIYRARALI